MAGRRDRPRRLTAGAARPPSVRELSAGGLVYRRARGRWVVCLGGRRRSDEGPLVWSIPKGHVEDGESMAVAALREVREETGLVAEVEHPLGDVTYWYARRDAEGKPVRIWKRVRFFLLRHRGGRFADRDDELDAVRWFPIAEAEAAVGYADERALVHGARERLEGGRGEAR
jgi:8-oxo-dGTP pyrophosphatase MutT (NUDIX family)